MRKTSKQQRGLARAGCLDVFGIWWSPWHWWQNPWFKCFVVDEVLKLGYDVMLYRFGLG